MFKVRCGFERSRLNASMQDLRTKFSEFEHAKKKSEEHRHCAHRSFFVFCASFPRRAQEATARFQAAVGHHHPPSPRPCYHHLLLLRHFMVSHYFCWFLLAQVLMFWTACSGLVLRSCPPENPHEQIMRICKFRLPRFTYLPPAYSLK